MWNENLCTTTQCTGRISFVPTLSHNSASYSYQQQPHHTTQIQSRALRLHRDRIERKRKIVDVIMEIDKKTKVEERNKKS